MILGVIGVYMPHLVDAVNTDIGAQEYMQIDILHEMDYTGDGVTVAIVDSGCINHSYFLDTIMRYNQVNGDGI